MTRGIVFRKLETILRAQHIFFGALPLRRDIISRPEVITVCGTFHQEVEGHLGWIRLLGDHLVSILVAAAVAGGAVSGPGRQITLGIAHF